MVKWNNLGVVCDVFVFVIILEGGDVVMVEVYVLNKEILIVI